MPKGDGRTPQTPPYSIINSPDDVHARQRKILSNSFSERAVSAPYAFAIDGD
jgi:cytochrome P450